jgi:hypothetical protein
MATVENPGAAADRIGDGDTRRRLFLTHGVHPALRFSHPAGVSRLARGKQPVTTDAPTPGIRT